MHKNNPSFTTIKRPQLTNYAMNEANLGVQVGINPSLFSDNEFWLIEMIVILVFFIFKKNTTYVI